MNYKDYFSKPSPTPDDTESFISGIVAAIKQAPPIKGVQGNSVSFSTIASSPNMSMSPKDYLQSSQADSIGKVLQQATSAEELQQLIKTILDKKTIYFKDGDYTVNLNASTINVLQELVN